MILRLLMGIHISLLVLVFGWLGWLLWDTMPPHSLEVKGQSQVFQAESEIGTSKRLQCPSTDGSTRWRYTVNGDVLCEEVSRAQQTGTP